MLLTPSAATSASNVDTEEFSAVCNAVERYSLQAKYCKRAATFINPFMPSVPQNGNLV